MIGGYAQANFDFILNAHRQRMAQQQAAAEAEAMKPFEVMDELRDQLNEASSDLRMFMPDSCNHGTIAGLAYKEADKHLAKAHNLLAQLKILYQGGRPCGQ